jgi:hypothetical protein
VPDPKRFCLASGIQGSLRRNVKHTDNRKQQVKGLDEGNPDRSEGSGNRQSCC